MKYIIENHSFKCFNLGYFFFLKNINNLLEDNVLRFSKKHKLITKKFFIIIDQKNKYIIVPTQIFNHLEAIYDQIVHCGNTIHGNLINSNNSTIYKGKRLYENNIAYGDSLLFNTIIKVTENNEPLCELSYLCQKTNEVFKVEFDLFNFISFIKLNLPCLALYQNYIHGLCLSESEPSIVQEINKHDHLYEKFDCHCPPSRYQVFESCNKIIKYKKTRKSNNLKYIYLYFLFVQCSFNNYLI